MGKVRLVETNNEVLFEVYLTQPGTSTPSLLMDPEKLAISIFLVSGASMSKPERAKTVDVPGEPTADQIYQSKMSCSKENATALLVAGFDIDEAAGKKIKQYQIPDVTIDELREEMNRLHSAYNQQLLKALHAGREQGWQPSVPPWQT